MSDADQTVRTISPNPCCGNCRHVRRQQLVDETGPIIGQQMLQCHAMPPSAMMMPAGVAAAFPPVDASWLCAQHEPELSG